MVRTRDETHVEELRAAGATEVIPETLEAGLMIAAHALFLLNVPLVRIMRRVQEQRASRYRLMREYFSGDAIAQNEGEWRGDRLQSVLVVDDSPAVNRTLADFETEGVVVTALVRQGERKLRPSPDTELLAGDALVLFGSPDDLQRAERALLG